MAASRCLVAVIAVLAILALTSPASVTAAPSTKNARLEGYTYTNNVESLLHLHDDSCQIFLAAAQGRPNDARSIFYNGSNALPLNLATLTRSTANQGRPLYSILFSGTGSAGFNTPSDIVDTWETAVSSGNPFAVLAATLYAVQGKVMFDYLDAAIASSRNADVQRNLDSAWSIFAGQPRLAGGCPAPQDMATIFGSFADIFGNGYRGEPRTLLYTAQLFGDAQSLSKNPSNSTAARAAVTQSATGAASVHAEFGLQYLLYAALSKDIGRACNNAALLQRALTVAAVNGKVSISIAKGLGATDAHITQLDSLIKSQNSTYTQTSDAVRAVATDIGISFSNLVLGTPSIEAVKQNWFALQAIDVRNCTAI